MPTEPLGIDSRPSLRVVRAIFSPRPSSPIRFSAGTRTSVKLITALARARRPMKWQRCSTLTPGQSASTTKALIFFDPGMDGHHHQQLGDGAVGAPELLAVEDVGLPSGVSSAVVSIRAGSEPTCGLGEGEGGDLAGGAARQVLLLQRVAAEELERLGDADRLVRREQGREVAVDAAEELHHRLVLGRGEAEAAVLLGDLHAEGAQLAQPVEHVLRVLAGGVDLHRVDLVAQQLLDRLEEGPELGPLLVLVAGQREGVDQVEPEVAEEELAQEAGLGPLLLAGRLRHRHRLRFADLARAHPWPCRVSPVRSCLAAVRHNPTRIAAPRQEPAQPFLDANSPRRRGGGRPGLKADREGDPGDHQRRARRGGEG